MNWRLAIVTCGCAGVVAGAAVATQYVGDEELPPPTSLFRQSATAAAWHAPWTAPRRAVAYHGQMRALLTMAATTSPTATAKREGADRKSANRKTTAKREDAQPRRRRQAHRRSRADDTVEVQVRDRHGRRIRVERVERERRDDALRARAYAPRRSFLPFFGEW